MRKTFGDSRSTLESVDKALALLTLLRGGDAIRIVDVSRKLGVAPSTAHRLMTTLVMRGFAEHIRGSKSYRAGRILFELGLSVTGELDFRREARRHLLKLAAEVLETVHLMMLEKNGVRFIDSVESMHPVRVASRIGVLLPSYSASGGKLLMAYAGMSREDVLASGNLKPLTGQTLIDVDTLMDELDDIRRLGYARNRGESDEEVRAIAVGVPRRNGEVVAALAVAAPAPRGAATRLNAFLEPMNRYAEVIGRSF